MTFENILDYESKCAGFGYSTRRENFHKNGKSYIVSIPRHKSGVETWQLFTADGTPAGVEGFVDENYPASLAALGYFQEGKTAADYPEKFPKVHFNGFRSIAEYEKECVRLGFSTRRVTFCKDGEKYFALVTVPPNHPTGTSIEAWDLFTWDETAKIMSGIISGGKFFRAEPEIVDGKLEPGYMRNGLDVNWLGKLAAHGYYPDGLKKTVTKSTLALKIVEDNSDFPQFSLLL